MAKLSLDREEGKGSLAAKYEFIIILDRFSDGMLVMSIPTPTTSHLTDKDFLQIYEPAEDTFLLLDALESEALFLQNLKPLICLEVGPASGVVITFLASILRASSCYFASDINEHAAYSSYRTGLENGSSILTCTDDMLQCLTSRLSNIVDVLLFNPPYVVTPSEEVGSRSIAASWAGGTHGREVIDQFLPLVPKLLSKTGVLYLLLLEENKPDEISEYFKGHHINSQIVMRRRSGPERLLVMKCCFE